MPILFISGSEIFVIVLAVVLLFGAKSLPELFRSVAVGITEFKKATSEIKKELDSHTGGLASELREVQKAAQEVQDEVSSSLRDPLGHPAPAKPMPQASSEAGLGREKIK